MREALHTELPEFTEARIDSADLTDVGSAQRFTWPAYVANLRARLERVR